MKGLTNANGKAAAGSVNTTMLADSAVTTAKVANSAITRAKLAKDALYSPFVSFARVIAELRVQSWQRMLYTARLST